MIYLRIAAIVLAVWSIGPILDYLTYRERIGRWAKRYEVEVRWFFCDADYCSVTTNKGKFIVGCAKYGCWKEKL